MKSFWQKNKYIIFLVVLTALAGFLRFWRLNQPAELVFDEVYYPKWAAEFLIGQTPYDVHPPLTKLLMAISELLFGNNPWGWRFFSALLGSLLVPLTYLLANKLFKNKIIAVLSAFLITFEGLFFVQSRIGIMEIFTVFFLVLSYYCFWSWLQSSEKPKTVWLICLGLSLGLALSCKWTNLTGWGLIILWMIFSFQKIFKLNKNTGQIFLLVCSLLILPLLVYLASFFIWWHGADDFLTRTISWHIQAFNFHLHLQVSHPYSSAWWTWPILARPVWYYYQTKDSLIYGIIALGNPVIWWSAILALFWGIYSYYKTKNKALLFCLLAFFYSYLPWILIKRIQFNYYFLPSLFFAIIILADFLGSIWKRYSKLVLIYLGLVFLIFFFFYPILADWPLTSRLYQWHLWFKSWI